MSTMLLGGQVHVPIACFAAGWRIVVGSASPFTWMSPYPPADRQVPAVTLLDGHPLALAWLGKVLHAPLRALGVTAFVDADHFQELYRTVAYAIDPAHTAYHFAVQFGVTDLPTPQEILRAGRLPSHPAQRR